MLPWNGVSCCLAAAVLFWRGRNIRKDVEFLKSSVRVNQLKDLAYFLDAACGVLPLFVSVSGRVGSDTPIKAKRSGSRAVIVEETAECYYLKHNDTGLLTQESVLISSLSKEVSWYVEDCASRVYVVDARGATGLLLTVAYEGFEFGQSCVDGTRKYFDDDKMLGVKRTEKALLTGTSLTVVGEAVKDDVGVIKIQRPAKGPFFVSPKSIDHLIGDLGDWARCYQYAYLGFTCLGVYLIARYAIQYIIDRRRCRELRRRVIAAAAQSGMNAEGFPDGKLVDRARHVTNERLTPDICVICLEQEYNAVFIPCGHMCCCMPCSSHLTSCPLCRQQIEQVIKTFRH